VLVAQPIETRDGRALELHELGEPDGFPVIVHHGTPSSGILYGRWRDPRIRLIGFDRAGYGASARKPGRTIGDVAADVEAIADALGLERFATWGISGGGPHALACAALCGERLTAVATLAAVAPWNAEGLDYLAGMGDENVEEFGLASKGEDALRPELQRIRAHMLETTAEQIQDVFATLLGPADRAVTSGTLADWLVEGHAHGMATSPDGWIDDDLAFVTDWGFDLDAIARPVLILQGGDDRFVPRSHGEWLAAHVPGNESRIDDADGHLTLIENRVPEVHDWLLQHS
jgi:pimeloyl-ACP methyl ester carboxylesterase